MRRLLLGLLLGLLAVALCAGCTATHPAARADHSARPRSHPSTAPVPSPRHLQVRRLAGRLPGPLAREAVVPLPDGRHALVAGGLLPGDSSSSATFTLDLRTGRTRRGAALPVPVHDTAGALVRGRPAVLGGGNATEQAGVQIRTPPGWTVAARLPSARSDLTAVRVGSRTLVVGGYDGTSPALGDVLATRDGRHWSRVARLPVPVRYPGVAVLHGAVWVLGGERSGREVSAVQRIDPATGRAAVVAHLPHALGHEALAVLGDRLLVAGGRTGPDTLTARMWWFGPRTGRFTPAGRLPHRLADTAVVQGSGRAWLVGGETPQFSTRVLRLALVG